LNVICCVVMYSGGMPILNVFGAIYCLAAYWFDKWCLLKGSKRPTSYHGQIMAKSVGLFEVAAFLHTLVTLWMFSNKSILPSPVGPFHDLVSGILGVTQDQADKIEQSFLTASEAERNNLFNSWIKARALAVSHNSCWLLLLIFLVFLVLGIIRFIFRYLLRPFLAPFITCLRLKCGSMGIKFSDEINEDFNEAEKKLLGNNQLASYSMKENERYKMILESLAARQEDIDAALRQAEEDERLEAEEKEKVSLQRSNSGTNTKPSPNLHGTSTE